MDRTGEFLLAVRSSKHIRDERVTTSDIIRPRLMIDPFLQNCMKIVFIHLSNNYQYKQMEISKRYIDSYSKEWKTKYTLEYSSNRVEVYQLMMKLKSVLEDLKQYRLNV